MSACDTSMHTRMHSEVGVRALRSGPRARCVSVLPQSRRRAEQVVDGVGRRRGVAQHNVRLIRRRTGHPPVLARRAVHLIGAVAIGALGAAARAARALVYNVGGTEYLLSILLYVCCSF